MEEFKCPSGRIVQLNLNRTTLRMAFRNPYLPVIEQLYEVYLNLKDLTGDEELEKKAVPMLEGITKTLDYFEALDHVVCTICAEPRFYIPDSDAEIPEGAVSIAELDDMDALAIFHLATSYLGGFHRELVPFRENTGSADAGEDV